MARGAAIITENFNRAGPALGANWAQVNPLWGDITISASTVFISNTSTTWENAQGAVWVGTGTLTTDMWASAKYVTYGGIGGSDYGIGVIARATTDQDGSRDFVYFIVRDNSTAAFGKVINGMHTNFNDAAVTWATGDILSIECEGTEIRACKNGTALGGSWTKTGESTPAGTLAGVAGMGAITGDDFTAGGFSSGGGALRTIQRLMRGS